MCLQITDTSTLMKKPSNPCSGHISGRVHNYFNNPSILRYFMEWLSCHSSPVIQHGRMRRQNLSYFPCWHNMSRNSHCLLIILFSVSASFSRVLYSGLEKVTCTGIVPAYSAWENSPWLRRSVQNQCMAVYSITHIGQDCLNSTAYPRRRSCGVAINILVDLNKLAGETPSFSVLQSSSRRPVTACKI